MNLPPEHWQRDCLTMLQDVRKAWKALGALQTELQDILLSQDYRKFLAYLEKERERNG